MKTYALLMLLLLSCLPLLSAVGQPSDHEERPRMVVLLWAGDGCNCSYVAEPSFGGNNAACVTVTITEVVTVPPVCNGTADCDDTPYPCKGNYRIETTIQNWAACCPNVPNQPPANMLVCINGQPGSIIPHGLVTPVTDTVVGKDLACQSNANSEETDANKDTIEVKCGTSCSAPTLFKVSVKERCEACEKGGA